MIRFANVGLCIVMWCCIFMQIRQQVKIADSKPLRAVPIFQMSPAASTAFLAKQAQVEAEAAAREAEIIESLMLSPEQREQYEALMQETACAKEALKSTTQLSIRPALEIDSEYRNRLKTILTSDQFALYRQAWDRHRMRHVPGNE